MHEQLDDPFNVALHAHMRRMGKDYAGDEFVNAYLKPLDLLLRADNCARYRADMHEWQGLL